MFSYKYNQNIFILIIFNEVMCLLWPIRSVYRWIIAPTVTMLLCLQQLPATNDCVTMTSQRIMTLVRGRTPTRLEASRKCNLVEFLYF